MNKIINLFIGVLSVVSFLVGGFSLSYATTLRQLTLEEMTNLADRVFLGTVVAVEEVTDANGVLATITTFSILHAIKGEISPTLKIKQFGVQGGDENGKRFRVPGLPTYQVGEEVVLFLNGTSKEGFTSPVGFGQGKFNVSRNGTRAFAKNELGGIRLKSWQQHGLKTVSGKQGIIDLAEFISVVEKIVAPQAK